EQSAVVWNIVKRRPLLATRSKVGVDIGPPNVLEAPKPTSSVKTNRIFGAPGGASIPLGKSGVESFARRWILPLNGASGLGKTSCSCANDASKAPDTKRRAKRIGRVMLFVPSSWLNGFPSHSTPMSFGEWSFGAMHYGETFYWSSMEEN